MRLSRIIFAIILFGLIGAGTSFAQTATPTATATATATATSTATPTAAITPAPSSLITVKNVSQFAYIGTNNPMQAISTSNFNIGGRVILMKAGVALVVGQAVTTSTSADNTVIVGVAGTAPHILGVVVGKMTFSQAAIGFPPASGDIAIIQIDGIVQMTTDAIAITRGDSIRISASQPGQATDGVAAGTVDDTALGIALNSVSTGSGSKVFVYLMPQHTL